MIRFHFDRSEGPTRSGPAGRSRARLGGSVLADAELARKEAKIPRATEDGRPWVSRVAEMVSVESDDTDFGHTFPESGLPDCQSGRPAGLQNRHYQPARLLNLF
jgi:hypothetical protein